MLCDNKPWDICRPTERIECEGYAKRVVITTEVTVGYPERYVYVDDYWIYLSLI